MTKENMYCPRCGGKLLYDGLATSSWGESKDVYRCEHCDYYTQISEGVQDDEARTLDD